MEFGISKLCSSINSLITTIPDVNPIDFTFGPIETTNDHSQLPESEPNSALYDYEYRHNCKLWFNRPTTV